MISPCYKNIGLKTKKRNIVKGHLNVNSIRNKITRVKELITTKLTSA